MTRLENFVEVLGVASRNYTTINNLFNDFAINIKKSIDNGSIVYKEVYRINGIGIAVPEGREYFTLSLAGRSVRFVLFARHEGEGQMMGKVKCFLVPNFADDKAHEKIEPFFEFELSNVGAVKAEKRPNFPIDIIEPHRSVEVALYIFHVALDL